MSAIDHTKLLQSFDENNYEFRAHALKRMIENRISLNEVFDAIQFGERIKEYDHDKPYPSALFLWKNEFKVIHVVIALNPTSGRVYFITAYKPDVEHYEEGFRIRRKR